MRQLCVAFFSAKNCLMKGILGENITKLTEFFNMKKLIKTIIFLFVFIVFAAPASFAELASSWTPEGEFSGFEGDISAYVSITNASVLPTTADDVFEQGSKALKFKHQSGSSTVSASYVKPLEKTLALDAKKDYVFSFDFKTNTTDGHRFIAYYDEAGKRYNLIEMLASNKILYLRNEWDTKISALSLNEPHSIKLIIDGETHRLYEIWVDGEKKSFVLNEFKALPEKVTKIGIHQNTWENNTYSYYDNFRFMAIEDTVNGVSYKIGEKDDRAAFGNNSDITVRASIKSLVPGSATMYLAVYDEDTLTDIKAYGVELKKGMNYPEGTINIDSNQKHLRVFMWNENLLPLTLSDILKGNLSLLEYKSRVKTALIQGENMPTNHEVSKILSDANDDGSFKNISYTELTTDFCYIHCSKLCSLALALANNDYDWGSIDRQEAVSVLNKGVEYWLGVDTKSFSFDNWYYENITVPEYMGKVLLIAEDSTILNNETLNNLADYMAVKVSEIDNVSKKDTGSNILQMQRNKSYYALYIEDTNMLLDCFERISIEMRLVNDMTELGDDWRKTSWQSSVTINSLPVTRTGIQSDYSTLFHGPQLYSGTYGLTFVGGVSRVLYDTMGLELFPDEHIKNIIDQVLEHYAYIGRGQTLDYNTIGRTISAKGSSVVSGRFNDVYDIANRLASLNYGYRQDELEALASAKSSDKPAVTGHKYFYKADYTAHTKNDYLFTLKTSSNRTIASEALSYANLKGRSLGDGVTFIYQNGTEYDDIFAAWDWYKLPGTTAEKKDFDTINSITYSYASTSSGNVGGVSDGINGATAMELIRDDLSAKKAWFMFDDAVVALGADVTLSSDRELYTTVNQCISTGDAKYMADSLVQTLPFGTDETRIENPLWLLQDNVGYIFDGNTNVYVENKEKSGDRYDISWDGASSRPSKSDIVRKNVFTIWFDHTAEAMDNYEYIIVPNADEAKLNRFISSNLYEVIVNNGNVQAVKSSATGEYQAVFWQGGEADFGDIKITADQSCIILARVSGNTVKIYASRLNPEVSQVTINAAINGETVLTKAVTLPGDGSTVEVK